MWFFNHYLCFMYMCMSRSMYLTKVWLCKRTGQFKFLVHCMKPLAKVIFSLQTMSKNLTYPSFFFYNVIHIECFLTRFLIYKCLVCFKPAWLTCRLTVLLYLFTLATSLVTCFEEFSRFNNSIQVCWKKVNHSAPRLEIVASCKYDCKNGRVYLDKKTVLPPKETSITLTGLAPGSECQFTLKAVYNPASIDKGISETYMVLPASKTASHIHV